MTVLPYKEQEASKKEQVAQMFNNISHKYDF
jgi:demethylmenaquinone methyltransferase/2-methoxy-6-polyprenyl-1,4-benzoquinol methylase